MDHCELKALFSKRCINKSTPDWTLERRQEHYDWAKKVIDQVRGINLGLESIFDEVYLDRPI